MKNTYKILVPPLLIAVLFGPLIGTALTGILALLFIGSHALIFVLPSIPFAYMMTVFAIPLVIFSRKKNYFIAYCMLLGGLLAAMLGSSLLMIGIAEKDTKSSLFFGYMVLTGISVAGAASYIYRRTTDKHQQIKAKHR